MLAAIALLVASANAQAAPATVRILVLDIKAESVPGETARALRDEVVVELARAPQLSVLSTEDLRATLTVEAESLAAGCDTSSCLAEVGAALGARYIVHGSVAKVGGAYAIYLNIFDTEKNEALARESVDAATEADLLPAVRRGAGLIRERVSATAPNHGAAAAKSSEPLDPLFLGGTIGAGVGAMTTLIGAILVAGAWDTVHNLDEDVGVRQEAQSIGLAASIVTGVGVVVMGAGAAVAGMQVME